MAPQVELPQGWMNFSMEKTPVRSSTDLPYSACRPLRLFSAWGSLGDPSNVGNADEVAVQIGLKYTGAAFCAKDFVAARINAIATGLDLCALLQVLGRVYISVMV
jgi:hypothetical protein